jgi:hypothetical protein
VRQETISGFLKTSGHTAKDCTLCPNGVEWGASTLARKVNPTYLFALKSKVKLLTPGQTWASANAHVGKA